MIKKECGRCKGTGRINKRYKDIWGGWHDTQECNACGGTGRNPDYREKVCDYSRCYETIPYSIKNYPFPKYCPAHKQQVEQEDRAERERFRNSELGRSLGLGSQGGQRGQGNSSVSGSPSSQKEEWLEKPCRRPGCRYVVRYPESQDAVLIFCKMCRAKLQMIRLPFETTDRNYIMPGMGETIGQMGGTRGKYYLDKQKGLIHCVVFEGMGPDDIHTSWHYDFMTEDVKKLHSRPNKMG